MEGIIAKRASLHYRLAQEENQNDELREKLEKFESLANVGLVSAMIAHEINNILTPLSSYAEMAMNNPNDEYLTSKAIEKAARNSQRATKILGSLLNIANGHEQSKVYCKIRDVLDDTFRFIARDLKKDSITVKDSVTNDIDMFCDPIAIQQVLMNLILNAREAMLGRGGILTLEACSNEERTVIKVSDNGPGIEQENINKIFKPFFSTKSRTDKRHNAGAGLGLAYCKRVVENHGGEITVSSEPGSGATFYIDLPMDYDLKE